MKFESKYGINELIEYKAKQNAEANSFGFIREVTFHKSDAINFSATYKIEKVNGQEFDNFIPEHDVVKRFHAQ